MTAHTARQLGLAISAASVALAFAVLGSRLFRLEVHPEGEILTLLKQTESKGLELPLPSTRLSLESTRHRFDRVSVQVDFASRTARAVATLDFLGKLGEVEVSSLGLEQVRFHYWSGGWRPDDSLAPLLVAVVTALAARQSALNAGDATRLAGLWAGPAGASGPPDDAALQRVLALRDRQYQVRAWFIRSEREQAVVTEEYRLSGQLPDKPVDEVGHRRLSLVRRGEAFLFWPALM